MNRNPIKKVILLGDSGVGKTSLMNRYVNEEFSSQYKATIGADFDVILGERSVSLQIWDTAGQERFQSLGAAFFRGSDACILVFDVTNDTTFENLNKWKEDFLDQADMGSGDGDQLDDSVDESDNDGSDLDQDEEFPFTVIGNKTDLSSQRVVDEKKVEEYCHKNGGMKYFECSAKDGTKVKEVFEHVALLICERYSKNQNGEDFEDENNFGFESFKPEPYKPKKTTGDGKDGNCAC